MERRLREQAHVCDSVFVAGFGGTECENPHPNHLKHYASGKTREGTPWRLEWGAL